MHQYRAEPERISGGERLKVQDGGAAGPAVVVEADHLGVGAGEVFAVGVVPVAVQHEARPGPVDDVAQQPPHVVGCRFDLGGWPVVEAAAQAADAGGRVVAEQHVEAAGGVAADPVGVAAGGRLGVGPAQRRDVAHPAVRGDRAAEGAAACARPGPRAAAVGPPQRAPEVQRPPRAAGRLHVRPGCVSGEAGPHFVVAV